MISTASPSSSSGALPVVPTSRSSRVFVERRFISGVLALAAGVLAGISTLMPWWTDSYIVAGSVSVIHFLPGGSLTGSSAGMSLSAPYALTGLAPLGKLYEAVLVLALVVVVLSIVGGILAVIDSFGRSHAPGRNRLIRVLLFSVLIIALATPVLVPAIQPYAFHASGGCNGFGTQSPCKSFWGNGTSSGTQYAWAGDVGYYLMIATSLFLLAAAVFWLRDGSGSRSPVVPVLPGAGSMGGAPSADPGQGAPHDIPPPSASGMGGGS